MKTLKLTLLAVFLLIGTVQLEAKKVNLRYNFSIGQEYALEMTTSSEVDQDLMGQTQTIAFEMIYGYQFKVLDINPEGNYVVENKVVRLAMDSNSPFGDMSFDTENGEEVPANMGSMLLGWNQSYQFELTPFGEVLGVDVPEELKKKMEELAEMGDTEGLMMAGMAGGILTEEGLVAQVQGLFIKFPDKAIKKGKSWVKEEEITNMIAFDTKSTYTLVKSNAKVHEVNMVMQYKQKEDAGAMEMEGMNMEYEMTGGQEGTYTLDAKTGLVQSSKSITSLSGVISIDSPQLPEAMTVPMSTKSTVTIEAK